MTAGTGIAVRRLPDLRLAGVALGTWLSAIAVLYGGVRVGLALAAAGATVGVGVYLAVRRAVRGSAVPWSVVPWGAVPWGVVLGVLLGVVCGAAATTARVAVRDSPVLTGLAARRTAVHALLTVADDPRQLRGDPGRPATYAITAKLHKLVPRDGVPIRLDARVLVLANDPGWRSVLPGQSVEADGRLTKARGGDLRAAVLSTTGVPVLRGPPPWHQRAAGILRAGLRRACEPLPDGPGGLLPGLVVGDTSTLQPTIADDFRATGMTHLTAVSGSNVAIVVGLVLGLARWVRARPRLAAGLSVVALIGFVVLARPSPSVLRAAVMGGLGLVGLATARQRAAVPALCATVAVLVIADPELASDAGFALSVLATAGLLLLAPNWRDALRRRGVPPGVAEALAVPAAAQVACAPVIAAISGTVSLVALPANLLVVPAIAPATVLGVAAAVLSPVWPAGAAAAAWLGQWPARWLVTVAGYGADLPAGAVP
ncbi:MAG TPA: ComEC/Rec2 family competence protein, partial [Micromonosporaceae bacterium]|nr:ComEC/Rec2 family competence protein [Micromonosporaceae bacterium]